MSEAGEFTPILKTGSGSRGPGQMGCGHGERSGTADFLGGWEAACLALPAEGLGSCPRLHHPLRAPRRRPCFTLACLSQPEQPRERRLLRETFGSDQAAPRPPGWHTARARGPGRLRGHWLPPLPAGRRGHADAQSPPRRRRRNRLREIRAAAALTFPPAQRQGAALRANGAETLTPGRPPGRERWAREQSRRALRLARRGVW